MDDTTISPSKRRALAPLDANALSPKPTTLGKQHSPLRKRAVEASAAAASPRPEKKTCLEDRSRSRTPEEDDESSLFDNNDASWASNTTPDVSPAPRVLTREQAREKAEILRLRLGLASYKLRTGQTSVPLANLVAKPLPLKKQQKHNDEGKKKPEPQREDDAAEAAPEMPRLRREDMLATPRRKEVLLAEEEEQLTSSALRGGAASGLLSLARGGSAD